MPELCVRHFLLFGWIILMSLHCSGAEEVELQLPEEKYYSDFHFPQAEGPAGPRLKPVPEDWRAVSLDGTWKLQELPFKKNNSNPLDDQGIVNGYFQSTFDDTDWRDVQIPSSFYRGSRDRGRLVWYRRHFQLTETDLADGRRVVIDFRRVAWQADVWVNGEVAGERHTGRFDSFQYDITPHVKLGDNVLAVRVYDYIGHASWPRRHIGGIYQPVRLLMLPTSLQTHRLLISSDVARKTLDVQAELINPLDEDISAEPILEITDCRSGEVVLKQKAPMLTIAPGRNLVSLGIVSAKNLHPWSDANPQLYMLRLVDGVGHSIGQERFGFRDFRVDGEWLLLNGQTFKPRAFTMEVHLDPAFYHNDDAMLEKFLRYHKSLGINMIRPHSGNGIVCESLFTLCDEIGLLVYLDWSGPEYYQAFDKGWKDAIIETWPSFRQFIQDYYSHPSICMWSFCNEIYENHYGITFSKDLDRLYDLVKALDRQGRPICSSTGRQTWEALTSGVNKERTDVLDDHQYRGAYCGSWQENIEHIKRYAEIALKRYGRPMPKLNCEYGVPGDCLRYRNVTFDKLYPAFQLDPKSREFKDQLISFLTSNVAEIGGYIRLKLTFCTTRDYVTNEAECRRLYAEKLTKRMIEVYRRAGTQCMGGHTNTMWYDMIVNCKNTKAQFATSSKWNKPGPIDCTQDKWIEMPLSFVMRRVYNPTLVSMPPFNQHPMPGSEQSAEIVVTNDLNEDADFSVVAQLRLEDDQPIKLGKIDFGRLKGMQQKSLILSYSIPQQHKTRRGQIELFLFKDGRRAGDNCYPVTIAVANKVTPKDGVAIYDSAEQVFRGLVKDSTTALLREFGLTAEPLSGFDQLDRYGYLIIAANSFDKKVIDSGRLLYDWVQRGGRILCFEQTLCGRVPFYPALSVVAGARSSYVDVAVPSHPLRAGLEQEDFDSWAGTELGTLYDYALSPLNVSLVAVAATGSHNDAEDDAKPIVCDVRCGKGQIILSQLALGKSARTDSVARACMANMVRYLLDPCESQYALSLPEQEFRRNIYLEDKDAFFVDLRKFANRGFADQQAGDRNGGWADFGVGFDAIPSGTSRLQGGVPFDVIDPKTNNGRSCIALKGAKRDYFPERVSGIPVNEKLNTIYALYTSMYSQPGPAVKFVVHYEDGTPHEIVATAEQDLPDWWNPKDRDNAFVVFRHEQKGLYLSEFVNPRPRTLIRSIDIVSCNGSIPIIVGITGRKRFSSVISGVGEQ